MRCVLSKEGNRLCNLHSKQNISVLHNFHRANVLQNKQTRNKMSKAIYSQRIVGEEV